MDARAIRAAKKNAEEAGVDDCIEFKVCDVKDLGKTVEQFVSENSSENSSEKTGEQPGSAVDLERGVIIGNPPYGIRIGEAELLPGIYDSLRTFTADRPQWSLFLITSDKSFEEAMGRPADRRRKLYNGNIESCYYQYHGKK